MDSTDAMTPDLTAIDPHPVDASLRDSLPVSERPAEVPVLSPSSDVVTEESSIAFRLAKGAELIPGYVLQERIGVGGYGEVWNATAPGGLTKAIKFVYGRLEESRALRELKSLRHAKGLRHPFLLTLERIEVVDGHLVIVMEMADSNVKARFQQARLAGLPGIPREELLGYLQEAADALDYLSESHSLQHLDVKPENLLLVSRHVKVGDFGLLKQVGDTNVSVISGLTPAYASPEVFDGRADRRSDQYSLAVVYQEMATGALPFDGRSAAALASQHVHSAPDLSGLTPQERFAIGKALSKDPARRFGSCRELVARLAHRNTATVVSGANTGSGLPRRTSDGPDTGAGVAAGTSPANEDRSPAPIHDGQTISVDAPQTTSLPALAIDWKKLTYRPAVFVGIGGTGGRVLRRLRQLLIDRFGDAGSCPALRLLWIDTDVASLDEGTSKTGDKGLREQETLAAPLRPTWHYRNSPLGSLPSVSRRWIYNIPRTLRTEGLRALGRLALLDHAEPILETLRLAIAAAVEADAVSSTAKHTGLAFEQTDPRVFLVASIAGGTGGGMVLDLAYAVRQVLAEMGLSDEHLCGLLTYSTAVGENGRSLAPASACACLQEMHYFSLPGSEYPGEPACKLARFRDAGPVFNSAYLVDLGDNLTEGQFAQSVDRLAMYLLLNSVSPAAGFFDESRKRGHDQDAGGEPSMRTMGLTALRADTQAIPSPWMESLCRSVARLWQGEADSRDPVKLSDYARLFDARARADFPPGIGDNMAAEQLADFSLTPEPLIESLREKVGGLAGGDIEAYLGRVISEGLAASPSSDWPAEEAIGRLHAVAGIKEGSEPIPTDRLKSLRELGAREASRRGTETGEALRNRLLQRVDLWEAHVTGARQAADEIAARLDSLETDLRQRLRRAEAERALYLAKLRELRDDSRANRRRLRETVAEHLPGYATAVLGELLLELAVKTVRTIRPFATACSDQLRDLWKDLNRLSEEFAAAGPADDAGDLSAQDPSPAASFFGPLAEVFARHCEAMVGQLDRAIRAGFFAGGRRLSDLSSVDSSVRADLIAQMRSAARKVLLRCVRDANLSRLSEALAGGDTRGLSVFLQSCCDLASPKLLKLSGGAQRLLLAVPESLDASRLGAEVHRLSGDPPTLVPEGWQEPLICYEAESLALDRLSARFLQGRPDCRELASRLHTRVDVSW